MRADRGGKPPTTGGSIFKLHYSPLIKPTESRMSRVHLFPLVFGLQFIQSKLEISHRFRFQQPGPTKNIGN